MQRINKIKSINKTVMIVITISMLIFAGTGCLNRTEGTSSSIGVKTAKADKHKLQTTLNVTGVLVPNQIVNISAKAGGQVKTIGIDVGSSVKSGDILIVLETKELNAQLQQAEAALGSVKDQAEQARINLDAAKKALEVTKQVINDQAAQAELNLDTIQKTLDRTKQLYDSKVVPLSQLEDVQSKYDIAKKQYDMAVAGSGSSAQSQLLSAQSKYDLAKKQYETAIGPAIEQANASINNIKVQLDNAIINSPITGTVVNKNISNGEIASPGVPLLTIADTSVLKLKGTVPQDAVPMLQVGQDINVSVDIYSDKVFKGKISSIGPVAVSTGTYFPIEISIANTGEIKAGLSARTAINMTTIETVVVPAEAVVQNNGQSYVFVVKDNVVSKRIVTVGLNNDKEFGILKGLEAGEQVAVTNVNSLFDNMVVSMD